MVCHICICNGWRSPHSWLGTVLPEDLYLDQGLVNYIPWVISLGNKVLLEHSLTHSFYIVCEDDCTTMAQLNSPKREKSYIIKA